jgi:threonine dehydrogenase-like Zn-dependent dehydrogenase
MEAVAVHKRDRKLQLIEQENPAPDSGEVLVRILQVGIDGTDYAVIRGSHGGFPPREDHLILGHEAVGVVVDSNGTSLTEGQYVVPTVRREPNRPNEYFDQNEPDMAPPGQYIERGIEGDHGFMSEYITSPVECLVPIPEEIAEYGFLLEPLSVSEIALEMANDARSVFNWQPDSASVLGNGSLGLLTLALLKQRGFTTLYCAGRRDRPDPTIRIIERMGATYVDTRKTSIDEFTAAYEPVDLLFEATGYPAHALKATQAPAPNGVAALLGVPGNETTLKIDASEYHTDMVLTNKVVLGSVNSNITHFESAVESLSDFPTWLIKEIVTDTYPLAEFENAFCNDASTIKTVLDFRQKRISVVTE